MVNVPLVWSWLGGSRTTHLIYIDGNASCWSHGLDEAPVASIVFWFRVLKSGMNDRPMSAYSSTHVWWPFQVLTHTHLPKKCKVETQLSFPFGPVLTYMFFFSAIIDSIFGELCRNQTTSGNKKGPFLSGIKASGKHCDFEHVCSCWLPLPILGYWSWNTCPWHSTILRLAEIGCAHIFSDEITIKVDIFDSPNSWWRNDLFWLLKSLKSTCLMVQSQYSSCSIQLWDS